MRFDDFILGHLPFWIPVYLLALMAWGCIARFMMQFVVPATSSNYIWRGFRALTDWPIRLVMLVTPTAVPGLLLPLCAAAWLFVLRFVFFFLMAQAGLAPTLSTVAPAS